MHTHITHMHACRGSSALQEKKKPGIRATRLDWIRFLMT